MKATFKLSLAALALCVGLALNAAADEIVKRGAAIGNSPTVELAKLAANPKAFVGKKVIVEGKIDKVCSKKGCWMELTTPDSKAGIRVTFKDYGFFVPTDSQGMKVRAEGEVTIKTHSKADAEHLAGEGARLHRNADGTATEVNFVASGVELSK